MYGHREVQLFILLIFSAQDQISTCHLSNQITVQQTVNVKQSKSKIYASLSSWISTRLAYTI